MLQENVLTDINRMSYSSSQYKNWVQQYLLDII